VREHQRVNSHLPIGWPVMPRGLIPKLVAYTKKKITQWPLRWYINPRVDQQRAYNTVVTEALAMSLCARTIWRQAPLCLG